MLPVLYFPVLTRFLLYPIPLRPLSSPAFFSSHLVTIELGQRPVGLCAWWGRGCEKYQINKLWGSCNRKRILVIEERSPPRFETR